MRYGKPWRHARVVGVARGVALVWLILAASATSAAASTVAVTEGQQYSGQVATVTASCNSPTTPNKPTITWGDSAGTSSGQTSISGNQITVSGTSQYYYAEEGSYAGQVSGSYTCPPPPGAPSGTPTPFTVPFTAQVSDATLGAYPGKQLKSDSNDSFSGQVAGFGDAGGESASDYTATINWGDGTSSAGTVHETSCVCIATYYVDGSHSYPTRAATYTVTVTIRDDGGQSTVVTDTLAAATPPPCPPLNWGGTYSQYPYTPGLAFQTSGAQPVLDTNGDPTGQVSDTVWIGNVAAVTPSCWYSVGDAGPPSDPGEPFIPTVHFLTYSGVAINGVYFIPKSNDSVLILGSDGTLTAENWCGLLSLKARDAPRRRAGDPCNRSTTYYVEVPQNEGQSGPLTILGQVDLGKQPITDYFDGSLGSFSPAPGGPQIGPHQINPGAAITIPGYPAEYQAQVDAQIDLPGLTTAAGAGVPATSQLTYYTQGPALPGSNQSGGGGGGSSGPENPCLEHTPPDCHGIPFQLRDRNPGGSLARIRPSPWKHPILPHAHRAGDFACPPIDLSGQGAAFLGGLGIDNVSLTCDASQKYPWTGSGVLDFSWLLGGLQLPKASFVFHLDQNGNFHDGFAQLGSSVPLFATPPVELTKLGIGLALHPTTFNGQASLSVLGGLLEIDGGVLVVNADRNDRYHYYTCQTGWPCPPLPGVTKLQTDTSGQHQISTFAAGVSGTITLDLPVLGATQLGGAYVFYIYPAYFEFGACLGPPASGGNPGPGVNCQGLSFLDGFITLNGNVLGAADMKLGQFDVSGNLKACANFPDPIGSVCPFLGAEVSNVGVGACGGISTPFGNVDAYVWFKYKGGDSIGLGGCDNNWPIHVSVQRSQARDAHGQAAQAGRGVVRLAAGLSSASLTVDGQGAPPRVTVTGPDGSQLSNPTPGHGASSRNVLILPLAQLDQTLVWIKHPDAGRWAVTPLAGSPPITDLAYSTPLPPASIGTGVTASHGVYTLHYHLHDPPGRTVTFIEQSRGGVFQVIGRAHGSRGSVRFTPALGAPGTRRIMALISVNGLPVHEITVGRYTAPAIPRAGTSRRVRIVRRRHALIVSWTPASGASGYIVSAQLTDGRHLGFSVHGARHSLSIRTLGPGTGALIDIYGIGPTGLLGRPAAARLSPPPPPGRVTRIRVRRTARGLLVSWHPTPRATRYTLRITITGSTRETLIGFTDRPMLIPANAALLLAPGAISRITVSGVSLEGQTGPPGTLRYRAKNRRTGAKRRRGGALDLFL